MLQKKINNLITSRHVLVAPLDWGLGHATRCIPVIKCLLNQGFKVSIAGEKTVISVLEREFPTLLFLHLPGYRISYSDTKKNFQRKLFAQIPSIIRSVKAENKWLKEKISLYNIDAVISDNRFGLFSPEIFSIFITHQLHIETGNRFLNMLAQKINYYFINKFNECWVPDFAAEPSLAGILSHPLKKPRTSTIYLGPLSRLQHVEIKKQYDLTVMVSGPEPQRSIFEKLILDILQGTELRISFIRGLPGVIEQFSDTKNITFHNHLIAAELEQQLLASKLILARCGYSTVMDLAALQIKAVLVPTPGQTEQEYLAQHLNNTGLFTCVPQEAEKIKVALLATSTSPNFPAYNETSLEEAIKNLLQKLNI